MNEAQLRDWIREQKLVQYEHMWYLLQCSPTELKHCGYSTQADALRQSMLRTMQQIEQAIQRWEAT